MVLSPKVSVASVAALLSASVDALSSELPPVDAALDVAVLPGSLPWPVPAELDVSPAVVAGSLEASELEELAEVVEAAVLPLDPALVLTLSSSPPGFVAPGSNGFPEFTSTVQVEPRSAVKVRP